MSSIPLITQATLAQRSIFQEDVNETVAHCLMPYLQSCQVREQTAIRNRDTVGYILIHH